jgi:RNA polymerase sigma-70 factor (ECF subfamily)
MEGSDDRTATIEMLHRRYAGIIFDLCFRTLSDRAEAEDAVQETFLGAFRGLSSFRYGESHLPWLYRIATNVCLKFLRTRRRKGTGLLEKPELIAAGLADAERRTDFRRKLEQLMDGLDGRSREIVIAHYIGGMDQGQLASFLGISRRSVVKRLTAVRDRARRVFEEESSRG